MSPQHAQPNSLEQLLRRNDIWRGDSGRFTSQKSQSTGYGNLDTILLNQGWPLGRLVEVCQPIMSYSEWLLVGPTLKNQPPKNIVLLNPPALPFAQGLIQKQLDLNHIFVVQTENKAHFLKSFVELARTKSCTSLLAWQPKQRLSYTDLRKCSLACADNESLTFLFRIQLNKSHTSPAPLRISTLLKNNHLTVEIIKQKGILNTVKHTVSIALPEYWVKHNQNIYSPQEASVTPLPKRLQRKVALNLDKQP